MLAALLLFQAAPLFARAQSLGRREKLFDRQELAPQREEPQTSATGWRPKMARDLENEVESLKGRPDRMRRVIIQLSDKKAGGNQVKGIMLTDSTARAQLQEKLARHNGQLGKTFNTMGLITAALPLSRIRELEYDDDIAYISPDRPIASHGHVETTTGAGANDARIAVPALTSVNGTGVGIAVLDSGIDNAHNLIKVSTGRPSVVYSKTYTSVPINKDYFGHGTHVASMLFGSPAYKTDTYGGMAYESSIISLGVLDSMGMGLSSNVIAAIDWCITNKATYNIRVINMSLGAPAVGSYKTDPLCLAARRAYNAGIVVVAAAGNRGKNTLGQKVYGGID
ncbi:MAG: S8 family serine peptidase, partial [Pyrinomonadaceae bacterium]